MALTAVDMPDPLENAAGDALLGGADDLLAQLAGDEVDRLLSEADAAPPDPRYVDRSTDGGLGGLAAVGSEAASQSDEVLAAAEGALDELDNPVPAPDPIVPDARSAATVIEDRAEMLVAQARRSAAELPTVPESAARALAAEMEADEAAHAEALRRMKGGTADPAPAGENQASFAPPPIQSQPATLELGTEAPPDPSADSPAVIDEAAVADAAAEDEILFGREPFLVRALAWINAPLDGLSQGVREALGKIALVTSINAIAVFLYVLLFRKH